MPAKSNEELVFLPAPSKGYRTPGHLMHLTEPIEPVASFLPDGRINPECPCLESAFAHRCGHLMRAAINCFNESKKMPRGAECEEHFMLHAMCTGDTDEKQK